jgi:hypothetical protein
LRPTLGFRHRIDTLPKPPPPYNGLDTQVRDQKEDDMMRDTRYPDDTGMRRPRLRRAGPIVAALLTAALLGSACAGGSGGPGVAGAGSPSSSGASPSDDPRADALAYSSCMRDHGITDFPDPDANGGIAIQAGEHGGTTLDPESPQFQAADEACKSLLPPPPSEGQQEEERAEMLEYARCMREHGFPSFPDPEPDGGINIDGAEHPELDPNNPQFQEANEACGGPGEGDTNTQTSGGTP